MKVICEETEGEDYVVCPLCQRKFKIISTTHLRTHGYSSVEEFRQDYPDVQLVSKSYSKVRSQILGKVNQSDAMRSKASRHAKELNKDSQRQSEKGSKGWTDERRQTKRDQLKTVIDVTNNSPEYADYRRRRTQGFSYGKRHDYVTRDGKTLKLKSFLECTAAKFLEVNDFEFEYETVEISYENPWDGRIHNYFPDFYLPDYNLLLEVKPSDKVNDDTVVAKKEAAEKEGYNFLFVTSHDLKTYKTLISKIKDFK